jgi:AraC-like DNA-binding protein
VRPELLPFIERTWASDAVSAPRVERVLPTGAMHLVLRFADTPLRLVQPDGRVITMSHALVGGARSTYYARELEGHSRSVGALLKPGVARSLFGVSAAELAERHTPLELLWGRHAELLLDRVASARDPLATFEAALLERLRSSTPSPFILPAVDVPIAELARQSGYSHRAFTEKFRDQVGLAPKTFAKVQRFQGAVALLRTPRSLADVAFEAGYADQSHLCRDFAAIAGLSPAAYRRIAPALANHVDFVQDARR